MVLLEWLTYVSVPNWTEIQCSQLCLPPTTPRSLRKHEHNHNSMARFNPKSPKSKPSTLQDALRGNPPDLLSGAVSPGLGPDSFRVPQHNLVRRSG